MFHEGCTGVIDAKVAKRVLTRNQYERYINFSDRAMYGEGMRCIFCENYVSFPTSQTSGMVECPYCVERFCMKCKKPWHYGFGGKCPVEMDDAALESWKQKSG